MQQSRIIGLADLQREIRAYGISRLARETGFSRQHIQRIAGGQRKPSARFLSKVGYVQLVVFKDLDPPTDKP
jgi:transcriptional regulator with XRE-family HTH domain